MRKKNDYGSPPELDDEMSKIDHDRQTGKHESTKDMTRETDTRCTPSSSISIKKNGRGRKTRHALVDVVYTDKYGNGLAVNGPWDDEHWQVH